MIALFPSPDWGELIESLFAEELQWSDPDHKIAFPSPDWGELIESVE